MWKLIKLKFLKFSISILVFKIMALTFRWSDAGRRYLYIPNRFGNIVWSWSFRHTDKNSAFWISQKKTFKKKSLDNSLNEILNSKKKKHFLDSVNKLMIVIINWWYLINNWVVNPVLPLTIIHHKFTINVTLSMLFMYTLIKVFNLIVVPFIIFDVVRAWIFVKIWLIFYVRKILHKKEKKNNLIIIQSVLKNLY